MQRKIDTDIHLQTVVEKHLGAGEEARLPMRLLNTLRQRHTVITQEQARPQYAVTLEYVPVGSSIKVQCTPMVNGAVGLTGIPLAIGVDVNIHLSGKFLREQESGILVDEARVDVGADNRGFSHVGECEGGGYIVGGMTEHVCESEMTPQLQARLQIIHRGCLKVGVARLPHTVGYEPALRGEPVKVRIERR